MVTNANRKILKLGNEWGDLPYYTDLGCYPLYYIDSDNNVLDPVCANNNDEFTYPLVYCEVNWEDTVLYCAQCGQKIESAYGEDSGND